MSLPDNAAPPDASGDTPANEAAGANEQNGLAGASPAEGEDNASLDLSGRTLCSDGACIGVIGPDGLCKVCGKPAAPDADAPRISPESTSADGTSADGATDDLPAPSDDQVPPDFDNRRLCSDGACIGVIGADDRCKVCGKPYTGEPEL